MSPYDISIFIGLCVLAAIFGWHFRKLNDEFEALGKEFIRLSKAFQDISGKYSGLKRHYELRFREQFNYMDRERHKLQECLLRQEMLKNDIMNLIFKLNKEGVSLDAFKLVRSKHQYTKEEKDAAGKEE